MSRGKPPCSDCTERATGDNAGCHARCERFKEWKAAQDAIKAIREKEQNTAHDVNAVKTQYLEHLRRGRGFRIKGGQR